MVEAIDPEGRGALTFPAFCRGMEAVMAGSTTGQSALGYTHHGCKGLLDV